MSYILNSGPITIFVLGLLSLYFILIVWIFIYRYLVLSKLIKKENNSLSGLLMSDSELSADSKLYSCVLRNTTITKELLNACKNASIKDATIGLTFLSIAASTSPFIGLFGTVVSILETFSSFSQQTKVTLNVIAPLIGEALVATAAGIFVATFAYSFYQIIKREVFKLNYTITTQIDLILSQK
jgi:biopolymer transport protein ExbB/TolQ